MKSVVSALVEAFKSTFHPKMLTLVLWPVLAAAALWLVVAIICWGSWVDGLTGWMHLFVPEKWLANGVSAAASHFLLVVILIVLLISVTYLTALVITAVFAMPMMVDHIARQYYPALERKKGGDAVGAMTNTVVAIVVYCLFLAISLPLWLLFPLSVVLPVILMAYLNQRIFRYDALAEHASREEIREIAGRSAPRLFLLGVVAGLMQFVPVLNLFLPVYMGLAFTHLCLGELQRLRQPA